MIKDKQGLENYVKKANQAIELISDDEDFEFIVTFKKPINANQLQKILNGYDVQDVLIYGRGINSKSERVTIGQIGFDNDSFEMVQNSDAYDFKGYIQLSGTAKGAIIKSLQADSDIYGIEITKDSLAMGMYWKLEDFNN